MMVAVLAATLLVFIARPAVSESPSPCTLPVTTGRCDAIIPRYAYYKEQDECREFMYGGCGGNANNFRTLNDCQVACLPNRNTRQVAEESPEKEVVVIDPITEKAVTEKAVTEQAITEVAVTEAIITTTSSTSNTNETAPRTDIEAQQEEKKCPAKCPNEYYISHYEELGCKAVFDESNKCCPARYDCSSRGEQSNDKCYHQGHEYNVDEELPEDATPPCLVQCKCQQIHIDKIARITCISVECPELFMGPLTEPNCVRQYQDDTCCSTSKFCAGENTTLDTVEGVEKCVYQGKTYIEGQRFYPDEEPCMTCQCQAGFTGKLEAPHCTMAKCNLELHYGHYLRRKCVPVYYEQRCCPIEWRCPDDFDTATNGTALNEKTAPKQDECVFGELRLSKGESLPDKIAGDCVTCSCAIPPVPTCVKNYNKCAPRSENPDETL